MALFISCQDKRKLVNLTHSLYFFLKNYFTKSSFFLQEKLLFSLEAKIKETSSKMPKLDFSKKYIYFKGYFSKEKNYLFLYWSRLKRRLPRSETYPFCPKNLFVENYIPTEQIP